MAPNTMVRIFRAVTTPCTLAAAATAGSVCQTIRASATVTTQATGIARQAGQRRTTSNTNTVANGKSARTNKAPGGIVTTPSW